MEVTLKQTSHRHLRGRTRWQTGRAGVRQIREDIGQACWPAHQADRRECIIGVFQRNQESRVDPDSPRPELRGPTGRKAAMVTRKNNG